jgi:hypothetical protein
MQPQKAPATMRAARRPWKPGARRHAIEAKAAAPVARPITRSFPYRSPSGPNTTCIKPYATAKPVTTSAAAPMPMPKSLAMRGSSASVTRIEAALANAASARRMIVGFKEGRG